VSRSSGLVFALSALVAACGGEAATSGAAPAGSTIAPNGEVMEAAENLAAPAASSSARAAEKEVVEIPAGKTKIGSTPGDRGRDPLLEPTQLEIATDAFDIDRDLYPNEPGKPPKTGVSREEAAGLCKARGRRLCTEVEWERGCKGPANDAFAGRTAWEPKCATAPADCPSGFGVLSMGAAAREWTASDVAPVEDIVAGAAAVRGASGSARDVDHRCARRAAVDPTAKSDDLGFRCCGGEPNVHALPAPKWQPTFRKVDLAASKLADMLKSVPQLAKVSPDRIHYFEESAAKDVVARADAGPDATRGFELTTSPLLWNPLPGEEILVVAGAAGDDAFVVAFYRLPGERYRVGSSLVLRKEKGPIVLGYDGSVKRRFSWATCWGCPGESGLVAYRDENRVVVTQE
jgi:hypothetical protein